MSRWQVCIGFCAAAGIFLMLAGCGGGLLSTSKTISNPLGLQGRSFNANAQVTLDGLTARLSVQQQGVLQFTIDDIESSGNPYEGMSRMEIAQQARLLLSINSSSVPPATFILRNVDLRIVVRASEGTSRVSPPVEFRYTGLLTLDRQPDGSYMARETLSLRSKLDRFDGSALIAILTTGSDNTVTTDVYLTAETSSPNLPSDSTVSLTLQLGDASALIRW
jgi:hypothetical protein